LALTLGERLGPYDIVAQIGEGGMGQVYRAHDTKLNRDVALKVLADEFANHSDRLARFTREAQTLASLNHPSIAAIYGLEESNGVRALVMELVEGEDLSQRIARGPIALDEALPIAKQICEALEAAHEQGIIHRDLKPANIKVRDDGSVKVLDFGLAKLSEKSGATTSDASLSPTITSPAMMTGVGVLLGTAAYMSPEQAKGRPADRRSDIWAFGCVLYEMITGRRAFDGETTTEVLGAVLHLEPNWDLVPSNVPQPIRILVQSCLVKDRRTRIRDITTAAFVFDRMDRLAPLASGAVHRSPSARMKWVAALAAAAIIVAAVAGTAVWIVTRQNQLSRLSRLSLGASGSSAPTIIDTEPALAITPDGSSIIYVGNRGTQLFVRRLDVLEPTAVFTGSSFGPFVSPDSRWIGFSDGVALKKVAVTGGPPVTIATLDGAFRGGTWGSNDQIIFATSSATTGLQSVAGSGGPTKVLTRPDGPRGEGDHDWPELLPGGRAVLFTILSSTSRESLDAAQVAVLDLQTGARKVLVRGATHARYLSSGHLVYVAGGMLRAVRFDLASLEIHGAAAPVVSDVMTTSFGGVNAAVANDGTLAYVAGAAGSGPAAHTLVWVDREGHETPIAAPPRLYAGPRLSPDGARVVVWSYDQEADLWQWDFMRQTLTRLTFEPAVDAAPWWAPDGRRLVFSSNRAGDANFDLYSISGDGTGSIVRLTNSPTLKFTTGMTLDGGAVVFSEGPVGRRDLRLLSLPPAAAASPQPPPTGGTSIPVTADVRTLIATRFDEGGGTVSPDGHWLAFESDSSGRLEIYVRPFPDVEGGQWLVSTEGGQRAVWAHSGRELFYNAGDGTLMAVSVEAHGTTWSAGAPKKLITGRYFSSRVLAVPHYDVTADGQRFLMIKETSTQAVGSELPIIIVQNWTEELKRLVPTK
jgi:eukaryotic-like serine/threonine-protein kinase